MNAMAKELGEEVLVSIVASIVGCKVAMVKKVWIEGERRKRERKRRETVHKFFEAEAVFFVTVMRPNKPMTVSAIANVN